MDMTRTRSVGEAEVPAGSARGEPAEVTALVERAKTGDADAFGGLMRLYERRIIAIGMQMGLSREDALDSCQDSFVKVFRYIGRFRSGETFFKWLYRIAVNTIYDHLRINRAQGAMSIDEVMQDGRGEPTDGTVSLATRTENADLVQKLMSELGCLTRQERIVFVLRDLQSMPTDEIGRVLSLSQVTVRRHCTSARGKLRERLFPRKS